jgi:hypothetical protein
MIVPTFDPFFNGISKKVCLSLKPNHHAKLSLFESVILTEVLSLSRLTKVRTFTTMENFFPYVTGISRNQAFPEIPRQLWKTQAFPEMPRQLGEFLNFFTNLQFWETAEQQKKSTLKTKLS